ncbi:MAG TPA: hypothetical protein PLQ13_06115 [Candidatus Krumholzibacteria bacterium]|nr:hypothetical protein [Candidatus Krumholzibacteria bacterium]
MTASFIEPALAAACVLGAAAYLLRGLGRRYLLRRPARPAAGCGSCGGCAGCPAAPVNLHPAPRKDGDPCSR